MFKVIHQNSIEFLVGILMSIFVVSGCTPEGTVAQQAYPPPNAVPTSIAPSKGPGCFVDQLNQISIQLPVGWQADPPATGYITLYNYDYNKIESYHGFAEMPEGSMKITISIDQRNENQPLEEWLSASIRSLPRANDDSTPRTIPDTYPYKLGPYEGIAYTYAGESSNLGSGVLRIYLEAGKTKVVGIVIRPAESPRLAEALTMLSTLDVSGANSCSSNTTTPDIQNLPLLEGTANYSTTTALDFTCSLGTFPGNEARRSTLPLQMPFRAGEAWIVGGAGSYYGNNHHCNFYNQYYATDWNKSGGNDLGANVVAVADGIVSSVFLPPDCNRVPDNRYGCFVQIDHLQGFRTLYAHLQDVAVGVGDSVRTGQLIGLVGSTGSSEDPHLHLNFWHKEYLDGYYGYYSQCYNNGQTCPNGETPYYPQGFRPSLGC